MKFIDPYELDDSKNNDPYQISASFLEDTNAVKSQTKQDLYFAAFARADKRVRFGFNATDQGIGNQGIRIWIQWRRLFSSRKGFNFSTNVAFIRFLPLACFFSSFFFREMSPP